MISIDYMFMHDKQKEGEEKGMPILVMKDRRTKIIRARVVPQKGKHWYAIKVLSGMLDSLGYKKAIFKSDQEPAILSLKEAVKNESGVTLITEESPEYDSQANGEIEVAIQMVQGQFRAMKDGLESRYGVRFDGEHMCIPWLMAHASDSLNRYHVYKDGRTGYQNWKGKKFGKESVEFGECVMYKPPGSKGKDKFEPRWLEGVWLGIADRSLEVIIGTDKGVIKVRDVRRHGLEKDKWDIARFNNMKGVPWEPVPGREGIEIRAKVLMPEDRQQVSPPLEGEVKDAVPRRVRITREQVRMQGFTLGCPGCRAVNRGIPAVNHSEECRKRFEGNMRDKGDERVIRADKRVRGEEEQEEQRAVRQRAEGNNEQQQQQEGIQETSNSSNEQQQGIQQQIGGSSSSSDPMGSQHQGNAAAGQGGVLDKEDSEMIGALCSIGLDQATAEWVAGSKNKDNEIKSRIKQSWDNMKLYGKGGKAVKAHINELYSPVRVNGMAERMGLIPGLSLDLTTNDPEDNMPWDFNDEGKRKKAEAMVKAKSSVLLIVSPMCAAFSRLQRLNFPKMDPKKVKAVSYTHLTLPTNREV